MRAVKRSFTVMLTGALFFAAVALCRAQPPAGSAGAKGYRYTGEEKRWAVQWINERLALLMEDGLITLIKCHEDDDGYEVFVSSSWDFLSTEEKRVFLRDLSRAREITQHSPYLAVRNNDTGEVLARVNRLGILIFDAGREYFFPLTEQGNDVQYNLPD